MVTWERTRALTLVCTLVCAPSAQAAGTHAATCDDVHGDTHDEKHDDTRDETAPAPRNGGPGGSPDVTIVQAKTSLRGASSSVSLDDTPAPEDALEGLRGVSLVRDGGPLAPTHVRVRGLTGIRKRTTLGPLTLDDPATGAFDLGALPFFASDRARVRAVDGEGGFSSLHLSLPDGDVAFTRGRIGIGSFQTFRADVVGGGPLASFSPNVRGEKEFEEGALVVAASLASTRGDFPYQLTTSTNLVLDDAAIRRNNDQIRGSALVQVRSPASDVGLGTLVADTLVFAAGHSGGIPGFSSAPPPVPYRGQTGVIAGVARVRLDRGELFGAVTTQLRARSKSVSIADAVDSLASIGAEVEAKVGTAFSLPEAWVLQNAIDVEATVHASGVALVDNRFSRARAGAGFRASGTFADELLRAMAFARVSLLTTGAVVSSTSLTLEGGATRGLSAGVRGALMSRAPTLDELYAPRGLVVGNPRLRPERSADAEVFVRFSPRRILNVEAAVFAGRLADAIVYVSQNAFEIAPVNTGGVNRIGGEATVRVKPIRFFAFDLVTQALWSEIDVTSSRLPGAPFFASRLHARVGAAFGPTAHAFVRHRSEVTNNLFGTLKTPPYTLVDLSMRLPLGVNAAVSASLANVLDVRNAQDANLRPLPGRTYFFSLEVNG